jgi:uncharacterized protein
MKILVLIGLASLLVPAVASAQTATTSALLSAMPREDLTIKDADGLSHMIHVEVALNAQDQANGLMDRKKMARDAGMLFFFGDEQPRFFWMKDTLIPLDMLFIRKDGTISHIHARARPLDESSIASEGPVSAVLELNGGAAAGMGIKEGDKVLDKDYFKNQPVP